MAPIESQRAILDFTLSSLLRRKGKNSFVLMVFTLIVAMLASVMFFTQAIREEAAAVLAESPQLVVQRQMAGRHEMVPLAYATAITSIPGVKSVRGRLWGYYYDPVFGATYTLQVPENYAHGEEYVVVGSGVARSGLAEVGNIMPFRTSRGELFTLTVAQVLPAESELVTSDLVLLSPKAFRSLFGVGEDMVSDLLVEPVHSSDLTAIAGTIRTMLPDTRPVTRNEILETYDNLFTWRRGVLFSLLIGAALTLLIISWDKAAGLSAGECGEIGILKAIGWGTGDILAMKLWEGGLISLSAFLAGIILAYVHVFVAGFAFFVPVLKGWSVLYPSFTLVPNVDPGHLALLCALSVIPYTTATVISSWRAASAAPDAIMGR